MEVRNLGDIEFDKIMDCFLSAFENYFVEMPTDKNYYRKRWEMAKVNFNLSYGMFDDHNLVGFIIHAIDFRNEDLLAFNTGTGVLPKHRGNKIVKSIYNYALDDLKKNGIVKCSLEVVKMNTIAIKSYKSIGFKTTKSYKCYQGELNLKPINTYHLNQLRKEQIVWKELPKQDSYSWDNQKETIISGDYEYFQILNDEIPESYFIINRANGYIPQFDSFTNSEDSWSRLFSGIQSISKTVRINNVSEKLKNKVAYLRKIGLKNTIDQFEMELII